MHIVVCVKQVPDTTEVKINPITSTLDRSSASAIINPYDSHAVEEAVRIKKQFGGKVTVLSMGPPSAIDVLKRSISLGADEGYLISDRAFAGSDTLATSYILSQAVKKVCQQDPFDLIICGKQAIDGDTAQVGPGIAGRLGVPQLTYITQIESIDPEKKEITVHRKLDVEYEVVKTKMPCLITVEMGINELTYSSLPNMIRAVRYSPATLTTVDLETESSLMGLKGSPTSVLKIFAPALRGQGEILQGDEQSVVRKLIEKLSQKLG